MTTRSEARLKIVQACNIRKMDRAPRRHWLNLATRGKVHAEVTLLGPKQIQQAVCMARRFRLVDDSVLEAAGFRGAA